MSTQEEAEGRESNTLGAMGARRVEFDAGFGKGVLENATQHAVWCHESGWVPTMVQEAQHPDDRTHGLALTILACSNDRAEAT